MDWSWEHHWVLSLALHWGCQLEQNLGIHWGLSWEHHWATQLVLS